MLCGSTTETHAHVTGRRESETSRRPHYFWFSGNAVMRCFDRNERIGIRERRPSLQMLSVFFSMCTNRCFDYGLSAVQSRCYPSPRPEDAVVMAANPEGHHDGISWLEAVTSPTEPKKPNSTTTTTHHLPAVRFCLPPSAAR